MINSKSDEDFGEEYPMQREQYIQEPRGERACWIPYYIELESLTQLWHY